MGRILVQNWFSSSEYMQWAGIAVLTVIVFSVASTADYRYHFININNSAPTPSILSEDAMG